MFTLYTPSTVLQFGKYKGMTLDQIAQQHASYVLWCTRNLNNFINKRQLLETYSDKYGTISFFEDPDGTRELAILNNAYLLIDQDFVLLEDKWVKYRAHILE